MATEIQYRIFKEIYDEESERYSALSSRANLYLTIITFYLGVILLKIDDVLKFGKGFGIPVTLFLLVGLILVCALLLTVTALGIREYEGMRDPEEIIRSFGKNPPGDDRFLDDRIVDLAVAANKNTKENDKGANLLHWAARLIFAAIALQLVVFVVAIYHARGFAYENEKEVQKTCCGSGR